MSVDGVPYTFQAIVYIHMHRCLCVCVYGTSILGDHHTSHGPFGSNYAGDTTLGMIIPEP